MHAELLKILGDAEIARAFATLGIEPAASTPAELAAYMRALQPGAIASSSTGVASTWDHT